MFSLVLFFSNTIIQCSLLVSGQMSHPYKTRSKITDTNSSLTIPNAELCVITDLWSRRCTGPNVKASTRMTQYCSSISGDACCTTFCSCKTSMLLRPAIASPCKKILSEYWNIGQIQHKKYKLQQKVGRMLYEPKRMKNITQIEYTSSEERMRDDICTELQCRIILRSGNLEEY